MNVDNFRWLLPLVPGGVWIEETYLAGEREGDPVYSTRWVRATSWPGVAVLDGEGNLLRHDPYWYQSASSHQVMSPNDWATQKAAAMFGNTLNPNWYEWIILGEYAMVGRREWIFSVLQQAGNAAGVPAEYDWTAALAYGARAHWENSGQPIRWLETPAAYPVHMALAYAAREFPALAPFVDQTGPDSQLWADTLAAANARRDAHDDVQRSLTTIAVLAVATMGAAAYFAPAAGAASAEGAAVTGTAAGSATATVQGAELAALVESGAVGAEGAFLEAAALSGSTVTYSTATGAVLGAVTPAGATVAFDASADAYAQFGLDAGAAPTEFPAEEIAPQNVTQINDAADLPELVDNGGDYSKLMDKIFQTAKGELLQYIRKMVGGQPKLVPAPVRTTPQSTNLQAGSFEGTLQKLLPAGIGAALALIVIAKG